MSNNFYNSIKGQGAIEYLLILAGVLVIATTVILIFMNINTSNREQTIEQQENFNTLIDNTIVPPVITSVDCNVNGYVTVYMMPSPDKQVGGYKIRVNNGSPLPENSLLSYSGNLISIPAIKVGVNTVGENYEISIYSVKNDMYSRPSTPSFNCEAHN